MSNIHFANPGYLFLLLLMIPAIVWYIFKFKETTPSMQFSNLEGFRRTGNTIRTRLKHLPFALRILAFTSIIIVIARPQTTNRWKDVTSEGIDIIMALDISGSMLAEDFRPNRLEAAKNVASEFIAGRPNDRIGLVIFSRESFTQCPLTTDHAVLYNLFKGVKMGMIEDGTAIGMGLATAVSRLKESRAISKVVILLTDGVNNTGSVPPLTAAEIAKVFKVRVYTIGIGTHGVAPYPVPTQFGIQYQDMEVDIDEPTLQKIANMTGGKYFRATNNQKLREIYHEIDKMEKSKIDVREYKKFDEQYFLIGLIALILLICEVALRYTWLRILP